MRLTVWKLGSRGNKWRTLFSGFFHPVESRRFLLFMDGLIFPLFMETQQTQRRINYEAILFKSNSTTTSQKKNLKLSALYRQYELTIKCTADSNRASKTHNRRSEGFFEGIDTFLTPKWSWAQRRAILGSKKSLIVLCQHTKNNIINYWNQWFISIFKYGATMCPKFFRILLFNKFDY